MLFVGTSIIHPSTEGVFLLCNILDLLIYRFLPISIPIQIAKRVKSIRKIYILRDFNRYPPISQGCHLFQKWQPMNTRSSLFPINPCLKKSYTSYNSCLFLAYIKFFFKITIRSRINNCLILTKLFLIDIQSCFTYTGYVITENH